MRRETLYFCLYAWCSVMVGAIMFALVQQIMKPITPWSVFVLCMLAIGGALNFRVARVYRRAWLYGEQPGPFWRD